MIFFLPYATDAALHHFPFATLGLIAINIVVFIGTAGQPGYYNEGMLAFGQIDPAQWVTAMFTHADFFHLAGNMIFLWTFGMVVESKVGWWKMLTLYVGIGVAENAIVQWLMLDAVIGWACGASGAIFGLVAISALWGPWDNVHLALFILYRAILFEAAVIVMVAYYLIWEVLYFCLGSFSLSSAALHVLGALLGGIVGYVMLLLKMVDARDEDLLSIMRREREMSAGGPFYRRKPRDPESLVAPTLDAETAAQRRRKILSLIESGDIEGGLRAFEKLHELDSMCSWTEPELRAVIDYLNRSRQFDRLEPYVSEYIERFPEGSVKIRLLYAHILLHVLNRPSRAKAILLEIDPSTLGADAQRTYANLCRRADAMIEDGVLELADD